MLDRHSEIIAHFIGQFDQAAEQSLFRLQYDAFRAQQRPDEEPGDLLSVNVNVTSRLLADSHHAGRVRWNEPEAAAQRDQVDLDVFVRETGPVLAVPPATFAETAVQIAIYPDLATSATPYPSSWELPGTPAAPETPVYDITPPGGIIVFAYQQNLLHDNDLFLARPLDLSPELAASRSDAALDAGLMALADSADALMPSAFTLGRDYADTATRIETLRADFASVDPAAAPEGAHVTLVSKAAGTLPETGILIDGETAQSLPDTLELALAERGYGAATQDDGETDGDGDETDDSEDTDSGVVNATIVIGPDASGPHAEAMQLIETGGNLMMNAAVSSLTPVDAPLIAVAGQAMSLTTISQVNVMRDRDTVLRDDELVSASGDDDDDDDWDHDDWDGNDGGDGDDGDDLGESTASEGHNVASVTWEGAARGEAEGTGGPLAFAITAIDGDLVLTTHVVQLNLISDNDVVSFETTFHTVDIGTGANTSVDVLDQLGFVRGFDMILVGGDMQTLVSISQLNILDDNDLVVDGDAVGGDIQTADNLLWNEAQVTWHGIDTVAEEVSDSAAAALDTMAGGQLDLAALKGESLLDGKQVPLLLTVGGNLVFDYRVEQINILADADTVQLFADAALDNGFNPVDVETGDNLLANVASLDIHGTDSTIMATGGVFSDLVIHQAGMYDTDDTEDTLQDPGGTGSDLASEAVVFLVDGMIDDGHEIEPGGGDVIVDTGGGSGTFDTLGGVVA